MAHPMSPFDERSPRGHSVRTVLESITDALLSIDGEGRIQYVNAEAERILGRAREGLIGRRLRAVVRGADDWMDPEALRAFRALEEVDVRQYVPPLGRWLDVRTFPFDGGLTVLVTDATAHREREAELHILKAAVDKTLRAVAIADARRPHVPLLYTNPAYTAITGFTLEDARELGFGFMRGDWGEGPGVLRLREAVLSGQACRVMVRLPRKDGTEFWCDLTVTPVYGPGGELTHFVAGFDDETDRVETAEAQRLLADELAALSRRLVEIQETERRALALDLHDEAGQRLTALKLTLETAARSPDRAAALVHDAARQVGAFQRYVRDLSARLRPAALDDLGLLPALHSLADWTEEHLGVSVTLAAPAALPDLPLTTATVAYRIVQEALTNVAKHAGVESVLVAVTADDAVLEIEVEDAGVGFESADAWPEAVSDGLAGMAERAASVGGSVAVESRRGRGTHVRATLPLRIGGPRSETGRSTHS